MGNSIADFRRMFYGNDDAEYQFLKDANAQGTTAQDLLAMASGATRSFSTADADVETLQVTGDAVPRYLREADGSQEWGGGVTARDVEIARIAANLVLNVMIAGGAIDIRYLGVSRIKVNATGIGFFDKAPSARPLGITNANTAHAFTAVFSNTELQNACNALGAKINLLIDALEDLGLISIA